MDSARTDGAVEEVLASLPSVRRLALAYGAGRLRLPMLGLMALDTRLGSIVRAAREPILGQLRLGWWRQTLARPTGEWPEGEPLLAVLRDWPAAAAPLSGLVDGWEELLGEPPLPPAVFNRLADARAEAFAALARLAGGDAAAETARTLAHEWSLHDLALHVSHRGERETLAAMIARPRDQRQRLTRDMRPLLVLNGLARRALSRDADRSGLIPSDLLFALRLGLLGH